MPKMTDTFPPSSKLLQRKWRDRAYKAHQEKMHSRKSTLDTTPPKQYPHVLLRLKKLQLDEERQSNIEYDNTILLSRMSGIMKGRGMIDNWNDYETKSLNQIHRERELQKIAEQNAEIAKRLRHVKPQINLVEHEEDYKKKEELMKVWSEATNDFGVTASTAQYLKVKSMQERMSRRSTSILITNSKGSVKNSEQQLKEHQALEQELREQQSPQVQRLPKIKAKTKQLRESQTDQDAKLLFRACKNLAPVQDSLNKTLIRRSRGQRMLIKTRFKELYDLDLDAQLRDVLDSDFDLLIELLLGDSNMATAVTTHDAVESKDVGNLVEILCTKNESSVGAVKNAYRKKYNSSIEDDIKSYIDNRECQSLLLTLCKKAPVDNNDIDESLVEKEAEDLHESGDGRWTSDSGKFIKLLNERSFAHVRATMAMFKQYNAGISVSEMVSKECSPDYAKAIQRLEKCLSSPYMFYAEKLRNTMDSHNPEFIKVLLSHAELDLPEIRHAYKKKYGRELTVDMRSKCKGEIGHTLVSLASRNPPSKFQYKTRSKTSPIHIQRPPRRSPVKRPDTKPKTPDSMRSNPLAKESNQKVVKTSPREKQSNSVETKEETKNKENRKKKTKSVNKPPPKTSGTVKPSATFNVEKDVEDIKDAIAGWGTDEGPLIDILAGRSNAQRQQIRKMYMDKYNQDLKSVLESELGGNFEELIVALLMTPSRFDAYCLHEAMMGVGTKESVLIAILVTRTSKELEAIKRQYTKAYGKELSEDIKGDTSGEFAELMLKLAKGDRDQSYDVNQGHAEDDAARLHQDGQNVFDYNSGIFREILTKKNRQQAKLIIEEYKKLAGHSLVDGIKQATVGDLEDALIALVKALDDPICFYTESLHEAMNGLGTDDNMLIRLIVSRSEIDLVEIKMKYQEMYSESLEDRIANECSGDYKKLLLSVVKGV